MGSNEPLGIPTYVGQDQSNLTDDVKTEAQSGKADDAPAEASKGTHDGPREGKRGKKRKLGQDELDIMNGMVRAVENVGAALKALQHNKVHEDLYGCIMNCLGYT